MKSPAPLKIGFDVSQTCEERAGCGWYADALIRAMVQAAPEHRYSLYHRFGTRMQTDPTLGTQIGHPRVNAPFAAGNANDAKQVWKTVREGKKNLPGDPDIVQSSSFQAPAVGSARLVVAVHDVSFWACPEFTTEANRLVCQRGVCEALKRADGFLFISQSSRDEFERVLPGWLERNGKPSAITHLASRLPAAAPGENAAGGEYWLAVGSLEPRKNYEALLDAMESYWQRSARRIPLHLAGGGGWRNERLLARLAALEERGIVRRLGYVTDADLPRAYAGAQALVFPSWYEGFGLPVLEAMQCGCPVISSDRTSLPEIGGDAAKWIDPANPQSICEAMLEMEANPAMRLGQIAAGIEQARRFTWEKTALATLDFYRKVLSQPS